MTHQIQKLKKLNNKQLIDVVRNFRQYGYDDKLRETALSILEERGISKTALKLTGNYKNQSYQSALDLYHLYSKNSNITLTLFIILLLTNILVPVLNTGSSLIGTILLLVNIVAFLLFFVFLIKSFLNQDQFYKAIGQKNGAEAAILYFLLGVPFYIIIYFYIRNQMKFKIWAKGNRTT